VQSIGAGLVQYTDAGDRLSRHDCGCIVENIAARQTASLLMRAFDMAGLLVDARFNAVRVIPGPPGGALQMVAARRPS
jgi:hypothetical protein